MLRILLFIFTLAIISCSPSTKEYIHYEGTDNVQIEYTYYSIDRKDFDKVCYYVNGQISSMGSYKDSLKNGTWKYWYADGVKERSVLFEKGEANYNENRLLPSLVFDSPLEVGKTSYVKVLNLYPDEIIIISENTIKDYSKNEELLYYNFALTPIEGDSIVFIYNKLERINVSQNCIDSLFDDLEIARKDYEHVNIFKQETIELHKEPILKTGHMYEN